jgi:uncharacterized protein YdiU (UPF0061 family)
MQSSERSTLPMPIAARRLDEVTFDNLFVRSLPADPSEVMRSREVRDVSYTFTPPTPVAAPELLAWSDVLGAQLGLERPARVDAAVEALAGNRLLPGMQPYSARYGGHQFGHWAGQLGDGRAITLGEMIDARRAAQELQLKGAGPTPYSRRADGRAVLRSSVREFLCSEAMFHLGIPTTRALSLVATGDEGGARHVLRRSTRAPNRVPSSAVSRPSSSVSAISSSCLARRHDTAAPAGRLHWAISRTHHYARQRPRTPHGSPKSAAARRT